MASSLLADIERIVSKSADQRTDREISSILPWFTKKSDVFRSLRLDAVVDIIRNSELIKRPPDNILIKQGDKGDCFFTILTGKVSIYIANKEDDEDEPEEEVISRVHTAQTIARGNNSKTLVSEKPRRNSMREVISKTEMFPRIESGVNQRPRATSIEAVVEAFQLPLVGRENKPLDRSKYGHFVGCIDDGKSFGELALIRKDCIRNASIITDTTTQLLVVNRQLYNRCIKDAQEKEFNTVHAFVKTSEYFEGWSAKYKKLMAMSLKLVNYNYGTPLICQGQPVDRIIFLNSGQCRLIIDHTQHKYQYPSYFPASSTSNSLRSEQINRANLSQRGIAQHTKRHTVRGFDVCLIRCGNVIGDVELTANLPSYSQSVICEQQTEGFSLDLRNYERLITRKNPQTGKKLQVEAMLKLKHRALRFKQIPLLHMIVEKYSVETSVKSKKANQTTGENDFRLFTDQVTSGPLVDIFGEGTVFHYIRIKRQQAENKKSRDKSGWNSLNTTGPTKQQPVSNSETDENSEQPSEAPLAAHSMSLLGKLFVMEKERRMRLEERIMAWHMELESAKLAAQKSSNSVTTDHLQSYDDNAITAGVGSRTGRSMTLHPATRHTAPSVSYSTY